MKRIRRIPRGFTLVELLVVIAIIAILISLLVPAVQSVRESGNRTTCQNNIKQLILATHNYHDAFKMLPTYNGVSPAKNGSTAQSANPRTVYGSWFVHLLPFVEQQNLYSQIAVDVAQFSNTGGTVSAPGGPLLSPAVPAVWVPPPKLVKPAVPATFNQYTGSQQWVGTINANGYIIYQLEWVPPRTPDPGTGTPAVWDFSGSTLSPGSPAVYGPPGPPINGYVGPWKPEVRQTVFPLLLCPSENTKGNGTVYSGQWGATNYLANYNAFTDGNPSKGYQAMPQKLINITDGVSGTLFFAEAYAVCENRGRTALIAWHNGGGGFSFGGVHNFGLTFSLASHKIDPGPGAVPVNHANGFPNPSQDPSLNFLFQVRPHPTATGAQGCNSLTVQTPHQTLNVAMGDGSVRTLSSQCTAPSWLAAMLPRDGLPHLQLD